MSPKTKRINANLPEKLLEDAMRMQKLGITETLVAGLELLLRQGVWEKASKLKGEIQIIEDRAPNASD